ncbi:MAG: hypothetical protein R3C59_16020 [Planctomycetaceae bacterium]
MKPTRKPSLRSALRQVLPSPAYLLLGALILAIIESTWFFGYWLTGQGSDNVLKMRDNMILAALALYGAYRVFAFHPLTNTEYRNWLKLTPWQTGLPLPLGAVHPRFADAVVVLALSALLADGRVLTNGDAVRPSMLAGILTSILSHATAIAAVTCLLEPKRLAYSALFLLGFSLQLSGVAPLLSLVILGVGWAVSLTALSQSWERFPWGDSVHWGTQFKRRWRAMNAQNGGIINEDDFGPDRVAPQELGWPFNALSPWTPPVHTSIRERLLQAVLFGWWMHAFLFNIPSKDIVNAFGMIVLGYGGIILIIAKVGSYAGNHSSPLNLAGRFWLRKWIIPKYDRAAVGPLVMTCVLPVLAILGLHWLKIPEHTLIPLIAVAALFCYFLVGPDPVKWKLTAPARIHHGSLTAANYQQLT